MIRHSRFFRHCSDWCRPAWKWLLPTSRPAANCVGNGAATSKTPSSPGLLNSVTQLRFSLVFVIISVVISSFPIVLQAASSPTSSISTPLESNSNSSSPTSDRLSPTSNPRAGRFFSTQEMKPGKARRLSAQYICRWKKEICEQEPISFLLGPDCCNSMCTNMKTDMFNCGTCGHICFYGSICCDGDCTDIFSNTRHCGACNNNCPSGEVCQYGICGYT